MKILAFDTETTGLFDYSKRADEPGQPRMAQIAMTLLDVADDWQSHTTIDTKSFLVKPDGWTMPAGMAETLGHGLTHEHLMEHGQPVADALQHYAGLHAGADLIAGFNVDYDLKVMRAELRLAGLPDMYGERPIFCIMRSATNICKIPKANGRGVKFPKLIEAVKSLLNEELAEAHNATVDLAATVRLLFALRSRGVEIVGQQPVSKLNSEPSAA